MITNKPKILHNNSVLSYQIKCNRQLLMGTYTNTKGTFTSDVHGKLNFKSSQKLLQLQANILFIEKVTR